MSDLWKNILFCLEHCFSYIIFPASEQPTHTNFSCFASELLFCANIVLAATKLLPFQTLRKLSGKVFAKLCEGLKTAQHGATAPCHVITA